MKSNETCRQAGLLRWFDFDIRYAATSDKGRVRKGNEDSFLIMEEEAFFGVADGAGGHENGARASGLTVESIAKYLRREIPVSNDTVPIESSENLHLTTEAIHYANTMVNHEKQGSQMASTIVGCQLHRQRLLLEHVGDSRCYLQRHGELSLLTEDHSFVNDLFRDGKITKEEMSTHKYRNVITRAIGVADKVNVDSRWVDFEDGDFFLLCSDGLTGFVDDARIQEIISQNSDIENTVERLVDQANQAGGRDNITALLLSFQHHSTLEETVLL
ncbi:MAG: Stp1/IreP family PP2C-type Ser/Thr phosphatase [Thermodesulfobacteriota bacterium]